jgi:cell division septation protein DedD
MSYQFGHLDRDERIESVEETYEDELRPPRRFPSAILALGVMALFAGGLYAAYVQGTKHPSIAPAADQVPLLRADGTPVKVKPDQPGGTEIPNRDNPLYAPRAGGQGVEKILPPPEAPAPRPLPPPPAPPAAAQVPPPATLPAEPGATAPPPAATAPKVPPKPATTPAAAGGPRVQLASLRSPEAAREEWARLKRENPDLLGKLTAVAVRSDLGAKGVYYRIEAGPLADRTAAARLCKALKERDFGCSLVQ